MITPAPVASRSAGGDVTVYSLDNGQPVTATPAMPAAEPMVAPVSAASAETPASPPPPSIKHKFFSWFHGSDNDTVTTKAPALTPPADDNAAAGPPPDSPADAPAVLPAAPPPAAPVSSGPTAPSDIDGGSSPGGSPPAGGRMLTGKSSALAPPPKKTEAMADRGNAGAPPDGAPIRVYFGHNVTKLTAKDADVVAQLASAQTASHLPLQVEGHASVIARTNDPVRRAIVNLKIAMDRALSVTNALIRDGVPAEAIQTIAFGDTRPSLAVDGLSEDDASRRVEIYTVNSRATDVVSTF